MQTKTKLLSYFLEDKEFTGEIICNPEKSHLTECGIKFLDAYYANHNFLMTIQIFLSFVETEEGKKALIKFINHKDKGSEKYLFDYEHRITFLDDIIARYLCRLYDSLIAYLEKSCEQLGKSGGSFAINSMIQYLQEQEIEMFKNEDTEEAFRLLQNYRNSHAHNDGICDVRRAKFFGEDSKDHLLVFRDFEKIREISSLIYGDIFSHVDSQIKNKLAK